jgi:hypothetical protein
MYGTSALGNKRARAPEVLLTANSYRKQRSMDQTKECWQKNRGAEVTTRSNGFFGNPLSGRDTGSGERLFWK